MPFSRAVFLSNSLNSLKGKKLTKLYKQHTGCRNSLSAVSRNALEVAGICSVKVPYSQSRPIACGTEGDPPGFLDNWRVVFQPTDRRRRIARDFTVQLCSLAKGGSYVIHRFIKRQEVICHVKRKKG